jgi:hypothetical protein
MKKGELPPHECRSFLLHRKALLHLFSTSVNSDCSSPTTQRFGSLGQRKTVVKCADYFGIGFTQQPWLAETTYQLSKNNVAWLSLR